MQCLHILGHRTFSCQWRRGQKQIPADASWVGARATPTEAPAQGRSPLPTGFVQQGFCHRVHVAVCASCDPGSRSRLWACLDSRPVPQNRQEGSNWHRICCVDSSVWWLLSAPLLDLHLFFLINDTLLSPPQSDSQSHHAFVLVTSGNLVT